MDVIYTYPIKNYDRQEIYLPIHSRVLSVQEQRGHLTLWVLVPCASLELPEERRVFRVVGTGEEFSSRGAILSYRGTCQMGFLMWHVFEEESF
jgi:hypothetical protein